MKEKLLEMGNNKKCPIAIIIRDDKILCGLRHYTPDKWKTISVWANPGGRCEEGETLEQALRREIKEEVGITRFHIQDYVGEVPGAKEGDTAYIFFCTTEEDATLMEPEKFSEWRWVSVNEYVSLSEVYLGWTPQVREKVVSFLINNF